MGQTPSTPQPGTKLQVIGAGLPRTGTTSLAYALEVVLDGPTHHGGTQIILSPEYLVKSWNHMLRHTPIRTPEDKRVVMQTLEARFEGFAAATDAPTPQFVAELLEIYPNAKVICTVRSRDKWVASMDLIRKKTKMKFLSWLLFPLLTLRHFPRFLTLLEDGRWSELYYRSSKDKWNWRVIWDRHMAYLERTVPANQLLYFDVKDGWTPTVTRNKWIMTQSTKSGPCTR